MMTICGQRISALAAALLVAAFCLCMSFVVWVRIVVHVRAPVVAAAIASPLPGTAEPAAVPGYPAEIIGIDETGTHVHHFLQKAAYVLNAFDGELLGADRGEWGGELVFRDASGNVHPVLKRNVDSIVRMPFGVVVFTGLSHLGRSTGDIFRIEKLNDGAVVAKWLHALRGPAGDLRWTTDGDLVFSVQYVSHRGLLRGMHMQCLLLDRSGGLHRQLCLAIVGG